MSTAAWLVIAAVCDCGHVAITVMDDWTPGTEQPDHDGEITATGPDWRPLVPEVARRLHERTGLPISGRCTVTSARNPEDRPALTSDVTNLVYAITDDGDQLAIFA